MDDTIFDYGKICKSIGKQEEVMGQEYTEWEINRFRQRYYEIKYYINQYNSRIDENNRELNNIRKRVNELQKNKE